MKVLHVTPTFHPATYWGGSIHAVYGLANALAARPGVEVRVVTTDSAGPSLAQRIPPRAFPFRSEAGYDVYYCARRAGVSVAPSMVPWIWRLAKWADVVHLSAVYSFPTVPTLAACRAHAKPLAWSPHGTLQRWPGTRKRAAKRLWELACNALAHGGSTALVCSSRDELDASRGRLASRSCELVAHGVEVPAPRAAGERIEGPLRLLYLGRLDPIKGVENLLRAAAQLDRGSFELRICGAGDRAYAQELANLAARLSLASVAFVGEVAGDEKEAQLAWADILVLPSHRESFGVVVLEALAHGVPVIASRGSPWSALEAKGCGACVDPSPAALASAIRALRGRDLRAMGARGREWVDAEFSWDRIAGRMLEVYRGLATR